MRKRHGFLLAAWLLLGALSLAGADLNIVFIPKSSDQVFWTFIRAGVDRAVKEAGNVNLTWRGPTYNDDTDSQIQILQHYTRSGIDAIVLVPTDRARLVEPARKAVELGIKLVVIDSELDGKHHLAYVATDNVAAGALAARHMVDLLQGRGRVLVFRNVKGGASTDQRGEGFVKALKRLGPGIQVVADEYGGGSVGKTYHSAMRLLKVHADLDGVFAVNESSAEGMLRALRETRRAGQVRFIGFDASKDLLDGLQKKEIQGLVLQDPEQMGYLGMKLAIAAARKEAIPSRIIHTGAAMLTLENLQTPEMQALLDPAAPMR